MRTSCNVVAGCFLGADIEPGTFHVFAELPTRRNSCRRRSDKFRPQGLGNSGGSVTRKATTNGPLPPQGAAA